MSDYIQINGISIDSALHGFITDSVLTPGDGQLDVAYRPQAS